MSLWLFVALLAAAVGAIVARPLLKPPPPPAARAQYDARVAADQLREVAREAESGALSADEAEAARRELSRRLLALDAEIARERPVRSDAAARHTATALALLAPAVAVLVYLRIGAPELPDRPLASRDPASPQVAEEQLADALRQLGERIREQPQDLDAWLMLGRAFFAAGRDAEAVEALRWASLVGGEAPELVSYYGEAMVRAAGGTVTEQAAAEFHKAAAADPTEPRARFYLALADYQQGRRNEALAAWQKMAADSPADAAWRPAVEARIRQVARELGQDGDAAIPPPAVVNKN